MTKVKCLLLLLCLAKVQCERQDIHQKMYETFQNAAMCFRILNGTHQFGCSTSQSGSTGVVHFINSETDVDWLLKKSKAGPYMAVLHPKLFTKEVMPLLKDSPQISGVLLAVNGSADRPDNMSPDDTCPNRYSSLSGSCDDTNPWNPLGSGFLLEDWTVPLFVVRDSVVLQKIHDCFAKFNMPLDDSQTERPLCSLQMKGHMYAAVDTPTCLRRTSLVNSFNPISYCDPMGDQNIVSELFPRKVNASAPNGSVVLVTARLDSAAMFDDVAPGAMGTVTGIVTLLTTAHLLSQLLPKHKDTYTKDVVFALLHGETHDYIGSSRMVYDMQQGKFLSADNPLRLEHIDQVIDLHQLDATGHVYCHCFMSNTAQNTIEVLVNTSKQFNVSVDGSCSAAKLPPSSLHSFLKASPSLPGIILTNHASQYSNMFYNGLLDNTDNLDYKYGNGSEVEDSSVQHSLAVIAQSLALSLARLVDTSVTWPPSISTTTTESMVDELLHCYLESRQCGLFRNVSGNTVVGEGPIALYVGVNRSPNPATSLTSLVLAQLTGRPVNATEQDCRNPTESKLDWKTYSYVWLSGAEPGAGVCMETGINLTPAVSPAFVIDNYNWTSGEYSSWTESVWPELSLRMFLRPPFSQELYSLISGLVMLFLSFTSVYWINRNSDQLFNPLTCERC